MADKKVILVKSDWTDAGKTMTDMIAASTRIYRVLNLQVNLMATKPATTDSNYREFNDAVEISMSALNDETITEVQKAFDNWMIIEP